MGEPAVDLYITFAVKSKSHIGRLEMLLLPWLATGGTAGKQSRCVYIATATVTIISTEQK